MRRLKAWVWTSGRFFATPFFGSAILIGVVLAGGNLSALSTWLVFICGILTMAGGHVLNTWGDWKTGLDKPSDSSIEKAYTGGCGLIREVVMSEREVFLNGMMWYGLSAIPAILLAMWVTPYVLIPWVLGMGITFWYTFIGKFTWTHELALASGPIIGAILGAMSTGTRIVWPPILATVPISILFAFAGLALDEYPDAEANLKKGVKSLAYKVWEFKIDLGTYLVTWLIITYVIQVLLISVRILAPLTAFTFLLVPLFMGECVFLKSTVPFRKVAVIIVLTAMFYPILLLVGQIIGG